MRSSTILRAGFLALSVAATPSLAQTGAPAGDYPGDLAPGAAAVLPYLTPGAPAPPYLAPGAAVLPYRAPGAAVLPPYLAPGAIVLPSSDTTGSGIGEFEPSGMDTSIEATNPSRKGLIDDE